jgi:hypothetical protein
MRPHRFLLDDNIYNKLDADPIVRAQIRSLTEAGQIEVLATPIVVAELSRSPFSGIPGWFNVVVERERIAVSGLARSGMATSSLGKMYREHRGKSKKTRRDAPLV